MSTIWKNGKYQPLVKYVTLKDLKKLSTAIDIINGDSDTKGSIKKAIKDLVGEAPEAYDTLKEIADKLKSDDDLHKALNDAIILKASSDALNEEINRATSAETANKNAIDGEVTRAKGAEKSLQDQITQLETSSSDALNTEISARTEADRALEAKINAVSDNACKVIDVTVDGVSVVTDKIANINLSSKAEISALSTEISARESADTTITTNLNNEITRASSEEQKLKKLISDLDTTKNLQIETSTVDNTTTYSFKQNNKVLQNIKVVNPVVKNNTLYL